MDLPEWACRNEGIEYDPRYMVDDDEMFGMNIITPEIPDESNETEEYDNGFFQVDGDDYFDDDDQTWNDQDLEGDYEDVRVHGRTLWTEKLGVSYGFERFDELPGRCHTRKPGRQSQHRNYRGRQTWAMRHHGAVTERRHRNWERVRVPVGPIFEAEVLHLADQYTREEDQRSGLLLVKAEEPSALMVTAMADFLQIAAK
jgi:hypothetical protein